MGFKQVYRYAAGKLDWFAFGLPMQGGFASYLRAIDVVRRDVPTCRLEDRVGEVYRHCQDIGWKVCLVVTESNVVLGRLRREAWAANPQIPVEEVMENGPTTFRPDNFLEPLVRRMQEKKVGSVIITNSDGELLGILFRKDAEEQLHQNRLMRGL